jgi:hypothetical protein
MSEASPSCSGTCACDPKGDRMRRSQEDQEIDGLDWRRVVSVPLLQEGWDRAVLWASWKTTLPVKLRLVQVGPRGERVAGPVQVFDSSPQQFSLTLSWQTQLEGMLASPGGEKVPIRWSWARWAR